MNAISASPPCLQATCPSTKKRHRGGLEMIHTKQHTHTPCEVGSTPSSCEEESNGHAYVHTLMHRKKCRSICHHGRRLLNLLAIVLVSNQICTDNHRSVSYIFLLLLFVYMVPHAEMHCQNCNHWLIPYIQQSSVSYLLTYCPQNEACDSTVGTGTGLQARSSQVWFPMGSLAFFNGLTLETTLWPRVELASNRNQYQGSRGIS